MRYLLKKVRKLHDQGRDYDLRSMLLDQSAETRVEVYGELAVTLNKTGKSDADHDAARDYAHSAQSAVPDMLIQYHDEGRFNKLHRKLNDLSVQEQVDIYGALAKHDPNHERADMYRRNQVAAEHEYQSMLDLD